MAEVKFLIDGQEQTQVLPEGVSKEVYASQVRDALIEAGQIDRNAKLVENNGVFHFQASYGEAGRGGLVKFLIDGQEQTQVLPEGVSKEVYASQVRDALIEAGQIDRNAKLVENNGVFHFQASYGEAG